MFIDLLRDIRNMEGAWVKVTGGNFSLSEYKDSTGRKLSMYDVIKKNAFTLQQSLTNLKALEALNILVKEARL